MNGNEATVSTLLVYFSRYIILGAQHRYYCCCFVNKPRQNDIINANYPQGSELYSSPLQSGKIGGKIYFLVYFGQILYHLTLIEL